MYEWADQILCATNATRININNFVRQQKGFGEEPEIGDKIISLRNHWEEFSKSGNWALTNGAIGTITDCFRNPVFVPKYIYDKPVQFLFTSMKLEDDDVFNSLPIDYICLKNGQSPLTSKQQYQMNVNKKCPAPPYEFAYAYGITVHKAQGSEWDKVLVFEENFPFDKEEHKRWLYTAITRAREKLVIVSK